MRFARQMTLSARGPMGVYGPVVVGDGSAVIANAGAVLDLISSTRGLRLTRPTNAAAVTSPAEGVLIYDDTANKLKFYTGAAWETVTSS